MYLKKIFISTWQKNDIKNLDEAMTIYERTMGIENGTLVLSERAPERDSMSVKQAQKFFNDVISASKKKTESIEEINARIKFLEGAVRRMEAAKEGTDGNNEHVKFVLKALIPFNGLARLIDTQHDAYGFLANFAELIVPGGSLIVRAATYKSMMDTQIKKTKNAIQYLENMKKTLK